MNWKTVGLTVVATVSLTACANDNGMETGQQLDNRYTDGTNYENMRFGPNDGGTYDGNYNDWQNVRYNDITRNRANNNGVGDRRDNALTRNNDPRRDNNMGFNNANYDERNGITNQNINNNARDNRWNDENNFEVADEAAERIASQIDDIERAYVLTTDNNAYVAAELNRGADGNNQRNGGNGDNVSDRMERQIKQIVQSVNNDIDNVYVSTNPDFVNLTNNYADDANNGEPVEGFFEQMGEMIERIFPNQR
ncbi:YhcN/YlaJ family sporulation lipoprotein [Aquibacillus albus]|uniref:YhcN/YlaJ family sporulation lipoprotein n=1 Tax=Aquibacillus albus TaxID=1168171 RepID=A0ABS2N0N6_9BACI|nr:YhcN/YlaJ family sporulation lipoprotein [Aquibacillus albus]MBM7571608.1 YhcN/YlaJ family sporulation lipoprotein [Aquibacillus albus]